MSANAPGRISARRLRSSPSGRRWPLRRAGLIVGPLLLAAGVSEPSQTRLAAAAASLEAELDGLWRYGRIARAGGGEAALDGLFFFYAERFVQQSLNAGEPWDHQLAQAHAGSYRREGEKLLLVSEVGLVVDPTREPPVDNRRDARHEVIVRRSNDSLTLTFGTGTVQWLERVGPGEGRIVALERGALALVDGRFLLAAETGTRAVGGSGTFEELAGRLLLRAERWFRIEEGKPTYSRGQSVEAVLEPEGLKLPDGLLIPVRR